MSWKWLLFSKNGRNKYKQKKEASHNTSKEEPMEVESKGVHKEDKLGGKTPMDARKVWEMIWQTARDKYGKEERNKVRRRKKKEENKKEDAKIGKKLMDWVNSRDSPLSQIKVSPKLLTVKERIKSLGMKTREDEKKEVIMKERKDKMRMMKEKFEKSPGASPTNTKRKLA